MVYASGLAVHVCVIPAMGITCSRDLRFSCVIKYYNDDYYGHRETAKAERVFTSESNSHLNSTNIPSLFLKD